MAEVMRSSYKEQLEETNGHRVVEIEDFELAKEVTEAGERELAGFPKSNVLRYFLGDETQVVLRPSGIELVIKTYVGTNTETYAKAEERYRVYRDAIAKFTEQ